MITKNGVCYDLSISPYKCIINNIEYVFSSKLHLEKFKKKLEENRDVINYSLTKRFNYKIKLDNLADLVLYKKIENRGFLVVVNGVKKECLKEIKIDFASVS